MGNILVTGSKSFTAGFLIPNIEVTLEFYEERPVNINLPKNVKLKVISTQPYIKGATATASYKPATLETSLVVQVPQFIREGDIIVVDTRTKQYLSRA